METILGTSDDLNQFCWEFVQKYPSLENGIYTTPNGELKIQKFPIPDKTPARVGHTTKIVQVQDNLNLSKSALLFLTVWCFVKGQDVLKSNLSVDQESLAICVTNLEWSFTDFFNDIIPILRRVNNSENPSRIEWIEFTSDNHS